MRGKPLCPRTLRWVVRQANKEARLFMDKVVDDIYDSGPSGSVYRERLRAWAGGAHHVGALCLRTARQTEKGKAK